MRALNSRRPRSSSTSVHPLVPRATLCFFLLLCIIHNTRARSVSHDDGDVVADQVRGKNSELVESTDEDDSDEGRKYPEKEILIEDSEKIQVEAAGDESSVVKKRRRNDVTLAGKSVLQASENVAQDTVASVQKDEGIRRFDAQVESDDAEGLGQRKVSSDVTENISNLPGDANEHDRQLIDTKQSHVDVKNADVKQEGEVKPQKKKYVLVSSDLEKEQLENIASLEQTEKIDSNKEEVVQIKNLAQANLDEARIKNTNGVNEEVRNDFRSLELGADANENERNQEQHIADEAPSNEEIAMKDLDVNREDRHLTRNSGNLPGREQESIVDGQIKKLISIRDDALELASNGAKRLEKVDERSLFSEKSIEFDAAAAEKNEGARNQRSSDIKDAIGNFEQSSSMTEVNLSRLQKWKAEAALLQEQVKNRTFLQHLKEQTTEVLPDIPKFTENQLLEVLKNIASLRKPVSNETYSANLNATELNEKQLEIIKCAEQLVEIKQRQSFMENMAQCIRGLNVLNCMRIFIWPIVLDNLPELVTQTFNNLPVEINLIDLFQGNRAKSARSDNNAHRARLLTPESVVFNILRGALESKITYDLTPTFIDSKNETLRRLLTINQLQILQMAERLLPAEIRREYSDRMFSCVRRFEYFSCIKYFAWPMVKQYYPALPDFPDYQSWYPPITLFPQYPIVPFPSFVGGTGELPEVVDADATRTRKPKPEAVIVNILQSTLKEHVKTPYVSHNTDSYVAVLPPEQLLSIHMAEQLLPTPYRPEFVQKTVKCIQEFNYVTCIKYSTWPTVKQFVSLPDISNWLPDGWQLPDVFGYFPDFQFPNFPDLSSFIPGLGSGGSTPPSTEQPSTPDTSEGSSGQVPTILFRQNEIPSEASNELENKVTDILMKVRNSLKVTSENPIVSGNVIILTTITEKQINILRLAESIIPPFARAPLVTQVLSCLQTNNDFINCTRYVIWPTVAFYAPNLPEFPNLLHNQQLKQEDQQILLNNKNTLHQTKFPQNNSPVISVTGTRFVPIFTEHPESVILNILKSIQLSSPNVHADLITKLTNMQQFGDLFNDQQLNILRITEGLLPDAARPIFASRMIECVRNSLGNFLMCSRDVLWPTLSEYFPRLPSFPNFGGHSQITNLKPILPQNLTDSSPFSETDVKIGQHGDATVTTTHTRFYPIFTEHPEGVILNILKAVQHATPSVLDTTTISKSPEITTYFSEQQNNIIQITESLLPESVRPVFVERMVTCVRKNTFLECTRDIAWPTIAQFFPRLPNFPNFGSYQNLPRMKLGLSSVLLRNAYSENRTFNVKDTPNTAVESIETKIESILKDLLSKDSTMRLENSYLDINNPVIGTLLTTREMNIIKLTEKAIPDSIRRVYVNSMLECVKNNINFITCVQHISWPTLKQTMTSTLPNFDELFGQLQIPGVGQIPGIGGIQTGISPFPGISNFGNINYPQFGILSDSPQKLKSQEQSVQSKLAGETNQISGVSKANTSSVGEQGTILGYLGQPSNILIDISKEKLHISDIKRRQDPLPESIPLNSLSKIHLRKRRSADTLLNAYYETDEDLLTMRSKQSSEASSEVTTDRMFPNFTESEFLQLLVNISKSKQTEQPVESSKEYFVDTLNSTIRNSLTADQYEILKIVETLNNRTANRGFLQRVVQCILSLSFIRCMGIFVWPIITTIPSAIGLPSLPAFPPSLGILGRTTESEVEHFFGMSTIDFEKELLTRQESMENTLLDWYKELMENKFQTNIGFLQFKGYGNGEVGISFSGFREGRATKIKDNKNLPSILTIISDIMEEVLDQRPDNEKIKKEKEKRERSLDDVQEADFQLLKESDEYADIKRSINDDQIITMFLDKIKANATDFADGDVTQFLNVEDAYNAFGVLFGTRLNEKFADRLRTFTEEHLKKDTSGQQMKELGKEELKVIPLKEDTFEEKSTETHDEGKKEHDTKSEFRSLLDKLSNKLIKNIPTEKIEDRDNKNKIEDTESSFDKNMRSELRIQLPRLREDIMPRKITSAIIQLGRAIKTKMTDLMPGIGFMISFLIQMALAHARAAASMAGMISNMALASASFSLLRQSLFGSENQKIKYVYDNDKTGPGISWPHHHKSYHHEK
ncbi:hypothetical protein X777_10775 [Ooceraea biroi]|uniref:Uncharacterized protein n=1 Tax=Ooceraea biroi TaxID=2015173 RepID=A0A026W3Q8_OOCBI|nr:hypothetical protein X777_10775 [Ooceraea biroi]